MSKSQSLIAAIMIEKERGRDKFGEYSSQHEDDDGEEVNKMSDDIAALKAIAYRDMLFENLAEIGVHEINIEYQHYYLASWKVTCRDEAGEHSVRAKTVTRALRKLLERIKGDA